MKTSLTVVAALFASLISLSTQSSINYRMPNEFSLMAFIHEVDSNGALNILVDNQPIFTLKMSAKLNMQYTASGVMINQKLHNNIVNVDNKNTMKGTEYRSDGDACYRDFTLDSTIEDSTLSIQDMINQINNPSTKQGIVDLGSKNPSWNKVGKFQVFGFFEDNKLAREVYYQVDTGLPRYSVSYQSSPTIVIDYGITIETNNNLASTDFVVLECQKSSSLAAKFLH
ncbi:UNKNOWN [Stylonychia lemnae]|uniref:Uncharacterized protein n=1 Tax=Stylonychia lemnae TaxID=5949 RepID=A0A077ZXY5_STYLE|nr:UNKNOWN [Stylonychia lemnae]|eukprot:CDW74097.1 UNKNOWN [Stylonychia lemnae]